MALALGKLSILVGAGLLGSVLAKDGGTSKVSDFLSGAFKIVVKHIQVDDSPKKGNSQNDSLMQQVKSLQEELQLFASSRSVTVITGSSNSGAGTYAMPILVIGVAGYGYIWWKGWKLSDMMFVTRRGFSDACSTVGKQLDRVSFSIKKTKEDLSSDINRVDGNLNDCARITAATEEKVVLLRDDLKLVGVDVQSVHRAVRSLEIKIGRIEQKQDYSIKGVSHLCQFVQNLEEGQQREFIQASPSSSSSLPALELPLHRTLSTPPVRLALEVPSPSFDSKISQPLQRQASASGLQVLHGISTPIKADNPPADGTQASGEPQRGESSKSSQSGWRLPSLLTPFITRTHSATSSFK
ncbi:uncharacterized protein LOC18438067 [Amborella trichopoda]|uniref:uncharacterized protein LOC18438067 n=1 Tax=Amborella trichopoda TaxID=13333 RepID=UPI0005D2E8FC|nr:uncharacterized protein LOC18438067 [Amborella trichopoda]|eukprot:XP_006848322.2 uncharacterized protein LOC18438067 [Amborella trichopoda]